MAKFQVETPDGTFEVEAPDMETAQRAVRSHLGGSQPQQSSETMQRGLGELSSMTRRPQVESQPNPRAGEVENRAQGQQLTGMQKAALAVDAFGNGVTLGFGDEINAFADSVMGRGTYDEQLEGIRAGRDALRDQSPVLAYGSEIAGGVLLPGAAIKQGAGAVRNTARAMGAGAAYGSVYGFGEGEGGAAERAKNAVVGAVGGAVGGALSVPIAKGASWAAKNLGNLAGRVFRNRKYFNGSQLTDEGREAIRAIGLDPELVSQRFTEAFSRRSSELVEPQQAARAGAMDEFGIPVYQQNATGDVNDFAEFEAARRGARGDAAAERVGEAADRQMEAARRAGEDIATDLSGGNPLDQHDAAVAAQAGLRQAEQRARREAGQAYDLLEASGGGITGEAAQAMGERLNNALRVSNVPVDDLTPNAKGAIDFVSKIFSETENGAVPFMAIERARQRLVAYRSAANRGASGPDQFAMSQLINAFDQEVDDLMTSALMDGSEDVLEQARRARGLWGEYRETFSGDGAASRFIQKMVDEDASPDDVAKWLFSSGKMGSGRFNSTLASGLRDTLGADSEAWSALRQGAFRQIITKPDGTVQPGPQRMSSGIMEFLNSPTTRGLAKTLYSSQERAMMTRYAMALKQMVPPPGAVNHSGTGYENARTVQRALNALTGSLGFVASGGTPGTGLAASAASNAVQGASNRAAVNRLVNPRTGADIGAYSAAVGIIGAESGMRGAEFLFGAN